jgi:hypothetical protein
VINGSNIFSLKAPADKEKEFQIGEYAVKIRIVKTIPVAQNPITLLMFLNNGLRNMFSKIGYT